MFAHQLFPDQMTHHIQSPVRRRKILSDRASQIICRGEKLENEGKLQLGPNDDLIQFNILFLSCTIDCENVYSDFI